MVNPLQTEVPSFYYEPKLLAHEGDVSGSECSVSAPEFSEDRSENIKEIEAQAFN